MAKHRKPCWWVSKLHGEWWAYPADPTKRGLDERFETHVAYALPASLLLWALIAWAVLA